MGIVSTSRRRCVNARAARLALALLVGFAAAAPRPALSGQRVLTENFERRLSDAWQIVGQVRVVREGAGQILTTNGFAGAVWRIGELGDFVLRFRYRHANGLGDVLLCLKGIKPIAHVYHVAFRNDGLGLVREVATKPQELKLARLPFRAGQWYQVVIQRAGGRIRAWVDRRLLIDVQDPRPLPPGMLAFGSLFGNGFAYDDITLSFAGPAAPPTTPPATPVVPVAVGDVGRRLRDRAGIANAGQLVQRLQTRQGLLALERQAGVPAEELVLRAQEAELVRVLGAPNVSAQDRLLLARMDIERPEELARFRGREQMLQQGLAERARLFGLPAPSMDKVARWVTAAAKQRSRLPQPEKLIPRAPLGVPPRPYKPIALGTTREGLKHIRQRVKARRGDTAPGPGGRKVIIARPLPIAALLAMSRRYEIKPPNKILDHEFVASKPGLYRAELTMERKGGWATLRWSVEKPQLVLRVQGQRRHVLELVYNRLSPAQKSMAKVEVAGYAPIIRCNKLLNTGLHMGRVHYLYFWVKPTDIPLNRRLRIRFEVLQNVNAKPFKDPAGIEQDPLAGVPRDPVVRGMVRVAYQPPSPIAYGKPKKIPFLNAKDPKKSSFPLAVVEAPLYTRSPKKGHSAYKVNVKLSPHPNRFVPNEMKWVKDAKGKWALKRLPHNVGILWGQVQVVADHTPVPGKSYDAHGCGYYERLQPPSGVYRILVCPGGAPRFTDLATVGWATLAPVDPANLNRTESVEVAVSLEGGSVPTAYVAELAYLAVSSQSEPDDDDNDTGLGEFKTEAHAVLSRMPVSLSEKKFKNDEARKERERRGENLWIKKFPPVVHRRNFPESSNYLRLPGEECYPGQLLIWWPEDNRPDANNFLSLALTVIEDDDRTWWQTHSECLKKVFGMYVAIVKTFLNPSSFFANFKSGILPMIRFNLRLDDVDDFIGHAMFMSCREWGFGLLPAGHGAHVPDALWDFAGPSDINKLDLAPPLRSKGGHVVGLTSYIKGNATPNIDAAVNIRRVAAPWSQWAELHLMEFALRKDYVDKTLEHCYKGAPIKVGLWSSPKTVTLKHINVYTDQVVRFHPDPRPGKQSKWFTQWFRPMPATYLELMFWKINPGRDDFIGVLSMTAYHEDFRTRAAPNRTEALLRPYPCNTDYAAEQAYKKGDFKELRKHSHAIFWKEVLTVQGTKFSVYVGEFTLRDPGYHLSYAKFRVFIPICDQ